LPELEAGLSGTQDVIARRDLIQVYLNAGKYDKAAEHLRVLLQANPNDPEMRAQLGGALVQQHQYVEAQKELLMAVQVNPKLPQAYTDLALAASENKDYALCLQALDSRAKLLPEAPGSLFLRAVAYDHLQDKEHAIENYWKFLELADGRFPDQEWQARHRIIAIDPKAIDPRAGDSRKRP
jgi:tetratricopeptide (TPR) repeat protein